MLQQRCTSCAVHATLTLSLLLLDSVATAATAPLASNIRVEPITTAPAAPSNAAPSTLDSDVLDADSSDLVFLPLPSLPVEMLCVTLYLALAIVATCKALALPTRFSAYEVKRRHSFQRLMALFALTRALSFLGVHVVRDVLNRAALCLFFSLVLFEVLFWIDIANPKTSRRSKRIWYAFIASNGVFYALVLGLSLLHVWHMYRADAWTNDVEAQSQLLTGVLPVLLVAAGSFASSTGLVYSTCKMRRRVGRVLKQTGGGQRRRLDERVETKLHRALHVTIAVMVVCSVLFLLRTALYVQRPFSHRGCGAIRNADVCVLVGYALPELVPCVLFLLLMWEVEPDMQFPSRRRAASFNGLATEATPLLFDDHHHVLPAAPLAITTTTTTTLPPLAAAAAAIPTAAIGLSASVNSRSNVATGLMSSSLSNTQSHRITSRRSSPLSFGLGGNVLEHARRRLELAAGNAAAADATATAHSDPSVQQHNHHAQLLSDARLVHSSNDVREAATTATPAARELSIHRSISAYAAMPSTASRAPAAASGGSNIYTRTMANAAHATAAAYAWLSFQCFNLTLPSSSATASSFLVLHVLDADTGDVVVEIGRSEISTTEDPCFHVMLPVEMRALDLLRLSVYSVRNAQSLNDLQSQWLVGDALIPLASFLDDADAFAYGRATLHALFSPLSRSQSSGEIVVRCEAAVTSASGVADDGRQRTTRSFMYFAAADDSDARTSKDAAAAPPSATTVLQHSDAKVLVEEELIESVYTWEIPYQLLQLILSDLVVKLEALKRENRASNSDNNDPDDENDMNSNSMSLSSTPISQISNRGIALMQPPPLSTSPGGLSAVRESDNDDGFQSSDDDHDDDVSLAAAPFSSSTAGGIGDDDAALHAAAQTRRSAPSIGMLSELIFQIQDDAMERKKRQWRHELVATMETYISHVEDAILRYGDTQHAGLTFKPSTMKADADLSFLALNLHQQLLTVGSAVPTSPNDIVTCGDSASSGVRYARLVDTFVGTIGASPRHRTSDAGVNDDDDENDLSTTIDDLDHELRMGIDDSADSADSDGESASLVDIDADDVVSVQRERGSSESPVEPVEALRRRVISFDSAENIVNMSASGRDIAVTDEQRKLAETIVALGMSQKDLLHTNDKRDDSAGVATKRITVAPVDQDGNHTKPATEGLAAWVQRKWREVEATHVRHDNDDIDVRPRAPFAHCRLYGTTTVGAFAAHVYGFKNGGIRQMRSELERLHAALVREAEKASSDLTLEALERSYHELKWHVERRLEVAFCQAMSALVTCFQQTLYAHVHGDAACGHHVLQLRGLAYIEMVTQLGFLFSVESLLSTYSHEAGMLGDMEAAVKELSRVLLKLRPVQTPREANFRVSITSGPLGIVIELPIIVCDPRAYPDRNMHRVPGQDAITGAVYCPLATTADVDRAKRVFRRTISVRAVLFSQGMNEMQTVANTVGRDALQREINAENVVVLETYYASFVNWIDARARRSARIAAASTTASSLTSEPVVYAPEDLARLQVLVERLKTNVQLSGRSKRMAILSLSSLIARSIGGGRVTCCKSAKDRTAMSITLEEANLLVLAHGLPPDERDLLTQLLRSHGVRRENARKNIGKAQYCFSALQNYMLPHDYKCPPGTGGGSQAFS